MRLSTEHEKIAPEQYIRPQRSDAALRISYRFAFDYQQYMTAFLLRLKWFKSLLW